MKRILVITTGGTIACEESGNGLAPEHGGNDLLKGITGCEITVLDLFSCDSTDITPEHWKTLCSAVKISLMYDGIVILHGTDTLEYTAAMLWLTVSYMNIPVIITGAMLPLTAPDSDGEANIRDSIIAACDEDLAGVYVVFCGRIISGGEAIKRNSLLPDAFESFGGDDCGEICGGKIKLYRKSMPEKIMTPPKNDKKIAVIKLSPFTEEITVPDNCSGVVIESFGAGGISDRDTLMNSIKRLAERIPVVMTTACTNGVNLKEYAVGQRALECGVIDGGKMSTALAAVKLWCE